MKTLALILLLSVAAHAAIDGVVTNGATGKPQAGSTVTLFQTTQQGPQDLGSIKTDAAGKFLFTQDVQPGVGGGPLLLQAVFEGVQYNKTITPGAPTTGVEIPVYPSTKSQGDAKLQQHFFVLEPSPDGNMQVTEGYVYQNDGKTTWNDPDRGTLQFELPAGTQDKMEVNVRAPGGLPIRRAPDPSGKPHQFKLDFPIKPGESSVEISWAMPFQSPGVFEDHLLAKADILRVVAPPGVDFQGDGLTLLGQEPTSKANIYQVANGSDVKIQVTGAGLFNSNDDQGNGSGSGQSLSENLPKLYGLLTANSSFFDSLGAVKWILITVLGMLALGFALLYRKGNPAENVKAERTGRTAVVRDGRESANARSRG